MPVGVPKSPFLIPEDEDPTWVDLYNRLHRQRILFLCQTLTNEIGNNLVGLLVALSREDKTLNFFLNINCRGGLALMALGVVDMMKFVPPLVITLNMGKAYSVGSLVLNGGSAGDRIAFPHSRVMIHQPFSSYFDPEQGEFYLEGEEFKHIHFTIISIYKQSTKKDFWSLYRDMRKDTFMTADEAKVHGIVDVVGLSTLELAESAKSDNEKVIEGFQKIFPKFIHE
uniref:ATP-dependent Clp protease proteolytic subunit n=1 Tax=Corydalis inopinata TaxID=2769552 RepID=A0A7G9XKD5_9MAGN|nr:ATP-dependent Clp protease proteolytic subunit [Corydalis inopinata]QNO35843.1 ATP-dependent Clp protease proteolytic subunit [Corydalis inopinata]